MTNEETHRSCAKQGPTAEAACPPAPSAVDNTRVAWLLPTIRSGPYWQPLLAEFSRLFPQSMLFTSGWGGYLPGWEDSFQVRSLGEYRHLRWGGGPVSDPGYEGYNQVPPTALGALRSFRPDLVFTSAFGLWTLLALLHRGLARTRVVVLLDGISDSCAFRHSPRIVLRRIMARWVDAAISNSEAGCEYLRRDLGIATARVHHRRFYVPDVRALCADCEVPPAPATPNAPAFLFVGQIIPRKGWRCLLQAASLLRQRGRRNFTVTFAGDGPELPQLQASVAELGLEENVTLAGRVPYAELGQHFARASALILPSLEDTWGMVVPEAMALNKAVLCSKFAGASELISNGREGYVFDPHAPAELAAAMERFLDDPALASVLGAQAGRTIAPQTPHNAARELGEILRQVLRSA